MITIQNLGSQQFRFNGIPYYKNFTPFVVGNKIKIVNFYDSTLTLCDFTDFSEFQVNGNTFASVALLADALLPVLYFRGSLGSAYADTGIVSDAGFSVSSNGVTMLAGSQWKVNGVQYSNVGAVNLTFPFTSVGFQRIDLIVANESNTFVRVAGTATNTGTVIAPTTPVNTVLYSQILIDNTAISNPNPPPISSQFWESVDGNLRNIDNNLNMLFRFLSQKGLTIDTPIGSPDWKVLRLLNNAIERLSITQNGRMTLDRVTATDSLHAFKGIRVGDGNVGEITQVQFGKTGGGTVRNLQLGSATAGAADGGGMAEFEYYSTDKATLRRELRLLCNLDLKRVDLFMFPGVSPINVTSETLIRTIFIPANTYDDNTLMNFYSRFNFANDTIVKNLRLRHSTSSSWANTHTLIATLNLSAASLYSVLKRTYRISGGNLTGFSFSTNSASDDIASTAAPSSTAFNPAVDNYIFISGFVANSAASITPTVSLVEKILF